MNTIRIKKENEIKFLLEKYSKGVDIKHDFKNIRHGNSHVISARVCVYCRYCDWDPPQGFMSLHSCEYKEGPGFSIV
jgi:hypothetical protein